MIANLSRLRAGARSAGWSGPALIELGRACDRAGVSLERIVPPPAWAAYVIESLGTEGAAERIARAAVESGDVPWLAFDGAVRIEGESTELDPRLWVNVGQPLASFLGCRISAEWRIETRADAPRVFRVWAMSTRHPEETVRLFGIGWAWAASNPVRLRAARHFHSLQSTLVRAGIAVRLPNAAAHIV